MLTSLLHQNELTIADNIIIGSMQGALNVHFNIGAINTSDMENALVYMLTQLNNFNITLSPNYIINGGNHYPDYPIGGVAYSDTIFLQYAQYFSDQFKSSSVWQTLLSWQNNQNGLYNVGRNVSFFLNGGRATFSGGSVPQIYINEYGQHSYANSQISSSLCNILGMSCGVYDVNGNIWWYDLTTFPSGGPNDEAWAKALVLTVGWDTGQSTTNPSPSTLTINTSALPIDVIPPPPSGSGGGNSGGGYNGGGNTVITPSNPSSVAPASNSLTDAALSQLVAQLVVDNAGPQATTKDDALFNHIDMATQKDFAVDESGPALSKKVSTAETSQASNQSGGWVSDGKGWGKFEGYDKVTAEPPSAKDVAIDMASNAAETISENAGKLLPVLSVVQLAGELIQVWSSAMLTTQEKSALADFISKQNSYVSIASAVGGVLGLEGGPFGSVLGAAALGTVSKLLFTRKANQILDQNQLYVYNNLRVLP